MKKIVCLLMTLMLLCGCALAETTIDGGETRNITVTDVGVNEPEEGISPVTGLTLSDVAQNAGEGFAGQAVTGRYMPMMVQIDNTDGGIGYSDGKANGNRAPWGVQFADVIYEAPLYKSGETRLTFLFSDLLPTRVGPVRSARLFHAWLREEWDCGFCFYGQQEYSATNVPAVFRETGATKKGVLFSGTVGSSKPWKQFYTVYELKKLKSPHNKSANVAAMSSLIDPDFEAANHTWLFTDELPTEGDDATVIYVNWGSGSTQVYNSILEWDEDEECYYRYMLDKKGKDHVYSSLSADGEFESVPVTFNNVIVQFTKMTWERTDAPNPEVLGTGNADYFMGGKHMAGVWSRDDLSSRTVFFDENGEEIEMQRGRTLIIVMDYEFEGRSIAYED